MVRLPFAILFLLLANFFTVQDCSGTRKKYLFHSVKGGEGFNLRRDAHMRAATLLKTLRERTKEDWTLVLPPWPLLPHWKIDGKKGHAVHKKWGLFFDLPSLNEYVPSIEFEDYIRREGKTIGTVSTDF